MSSVTKHYIKNNGKFLTCEETHGPDVPENLYTTVVNASQGPKKPSAGKPPLAPTRQSKRSRTGASSYAAASSSAALGSAAAYFGSAASGSAAAKKTSLFASVQRPSLQELTTIVYDNPCVNDLSHDVNKDSIEQIFKWPLPRIDITSPFYVLEQKKNIQGIAECNNPQFLLRESRPWSVLDDGQEMCDDIAGPRQYAFSTDTKKDALNKFYEIVGRPVVSLTAATLKTKDYRTVYDLQVQGSNLRAIRIPVSLASALETIDPRSRLIVRRQGRNGTDRFKIIMNKKNDKNGHTALSFGTRTNVERPYSSAFATASTCLKLNIDTEMRSIYIDYLQIVPVYELKEYISPTMTPAGPRSKLTIEDIRHNYKSNHCAKKLGPSETDDSCETELGAPENDFNSSHWCDLAKAMALHFKCLYIYLSDQMRVEMGPRLKKKDIHGQDVEIVRVIEDPDFQWLHLASYSIAIEGCTKYEKYLGVKPNNGIVKKGRGNPTEYYFMHPVAYDYITKDPNGYLRKKQVKHLPIEIQDTLTDLFGIIDPEEHIYGQNGIVKQIVDLYITDRQSFMPSLRNNAYAKKTFTLEDKLNYAETSVFIWHLVTKDIRALSAIAADNAGMQSRLDAWPQKQYIAAGSLMAQMITMPLEKHLENFLQHFDAYGWIYTSNTFRLSSVTVESWENCT